MSPTEQDSADDADPAEVPLSREDQGSILVLAEELRAPVDLVAQLYARELTRLRPAARVKKFLPLVVSHLVRRLHGMGRPSHGAKG